MLSVFKNIKIPFSEIEINPIRSQGSGGQNVNKVSTAIHLRFDINASSLPAIYKQRLFRLNDQRINNEGIVVIKAQKHRSQAKNIEDALARLQEMVERVAVTPKKRVATKPKPIARRKRIDRKVKRGLLKTLRRKVIVTKDDRNV